MTTSATILIVDDQPMNLRVLCQALEQAAYAVRVVDSGDAAITSIQLDAPDLILLDVMMPGLDGFETCRRIKASAAHEVPVIFMTALTDPVDEVAGFQVGAVDYITKPIQVETLLARVDTHLTLCRLRRTLQRQNAELDAYARSVAHDLKNPLAAVLSATHFAHTQLDALPPQDLAAYLQIAVTAAQHALATIDALLLLASSRQTEVEIQTLSMAEIVNRAMMRLSNQIETSGGTIAMPKQWPLVRGHAAWVELIWFNYLSNGLKYSGRPPHLALGVDSQSDGMVRFWVQDNGLGLAPELQLRLFTEFTRLAPERGEGHGLGLAIVRRIVEKLGGEAGVESAVGQGCRFYFTLSAALPDE